MARSNPKSEEQSESGSRSDGGCARHASQGIPGDVEGKSGRLSLLESQGTAIQRDEGGAVGPLAATRQAEVKRAGMHAFRHCHASLLMDVGANPTVTKDQMRHSDARITLGVYGHVIGDSQRDAVDKVGELLRPELCAQMRPN